MRNLPYGFDIYLVNVKTTRQIAKIFVAFSEKLNFMIMKHVCISYMLYISDGKHCPDNTIVTIVVVASLGHFQTLHCDWLSIQKAIALLLPKNLNVLHFSIYRQESGITKPCEIIIHKYHKVVNINTSL